MARLGQSAIPPLRYSALSCDGFCSPVKRRTKEKPMIEQRFTQRKKPSDYTYLPAFAAGVDIMTLAL
jgi:hypothetical protein